MHAIEESRTTTRPNFGGDERSKAQGQDGSSSSRLREEYDSRPTSS